MSYDIFISNIHGEVCLLKYLESQIRCRHIICFIGTVQDTPVSDVE